MKGTRWNEQQPSDIWLIHFQWGSYIERKSREINLFGTQKNGGDFTAFLTPFKDAAYEKESLNVPTLLFNDIMEN